MYERERLTHWWGEGTEVCSAYKLPLERTEHNARKLHIMLIFQLQLQLQLIVLIILLS